MDSDARPDGDVVDERAVDGPADETDAPRITAHESKPGRLVFTESENTDAWIATDHTVNLRR